MDEPVNQQLRFNAEFSSQHSGRYNICIAAPIHLSVSPSLSPSLMNKILELVHLGQKLGPSPGCLYHLLLPENHDHRC